MKKIIIITILSSLFIIGCAVDQKIILIPQKTYYPTFNTEDFNESSKFKLELWVEEDDKGEYLVTEKDVGLAFIKDTKELRKKYNLLLRKIRKFNKKIQELNKKIQSEKPIEIK